MKKGDKAGHWELISEVFYKKKIRYFKCKCSISGVIRDVTERNLLDGKSTISQEGRYILGPKHKTSAQSKIVPDQRLREKWLRIYSKQKDKMSWDSSSAFLLWVVGQSKYKQEKAKLWSLDFLLAELTDTTSYIDLQLNLAFPSIDTKKWNRVYGGIKARCYHENNHSYPLYGGRGIRMAEEWRNPHGFLRWIAKQPKRLREAADIQIDRKDNYADYGPDNCRLVSPKINAANKRTRRRIVYRGSNRPLPEVASYFPRLGLRNLNRLLERGHTIEQIEEAYTFLFL